MAAGIVSYLSDKDRLAKTMMDHDIRYQSMASTVLRGLTKPIKKFGAHKGQAVEIEKYKKLSKATGELSELVTMPMQKPTINFTTVTVKEYGNGVSYTKKAASIAEYALDETLKRILSINITESMDKVAYNEAFSKADVFWTPTGTASSPTGTYDTDGTVSTAATRHIQSFDIRQIVTRMRADNIPHWDGAYYMGIFNPFAKERLFEDTNAGSVVDIHKYNQPEALIKGEIGNYFGLRVVEETNSLSNTLGTTSYEGEVLILGFEPVVEALVEPEHIESESWDFRRFTGIAWLALTGFAKVWTQATDGEYRMVRIWST